MRLKFILAVLILSGGSLHAQQYAITPSVIAGGGGSGAGGSYSLSGTIGQVNAGASSGGNYSLNAGFWAPSNLMTALQPLLNIQFTTTNTVVVSWPLAASDFSLKQNNDLTLSTWSTPPEPALTEGTNKYIIADLNGGTRFFRLQGP